MKGLETFRQWFASFEDHFVIIGGMAAHILAEDAGLQFRGTKDIDIVLCLEALNPAFLKRFWEFVAEGGYEAQNSAGERQFYRFRRAKKEEFPFMIELFSRKPDAIVVPESCHVTPIPAPEELSSLSAILLDDNYYECLIKGRRVVQGLPVLEPSMLIPFKAYAYLNFQEMKANGKEIKEDEMEKHRRDAFRLLPLLGEETRIELPAPVKADLERFIDEVSKDPQFDPQKFMTGGVSKDEAIARLKLIYTI